jgi:hypothetical protein
MRREVETLKFAGWSDDRIARVLKISRDTLVKYFAHELEHGVDLVRREQIGNLKRAAKRGSVAAVKALLALDLVAAPGPKFPADQPAAEEVSAVAPAVLGKKDQANLEAQTAEQGTSWGNILKH